MKQNIFRLLSCAILLAAVVIPLHATSQIGETYHYNLCPGDTISKLTTRSVVVYSDTIVYDTVILANIPEPDTIITVYDVNVYPKFEKTEYKELEIGATITWCGMSIDRAGTYVRRYQSVHGCDSIHRLVVTEHVYTTVEHHIVDTLCAGSSMSFGHQTLTMPGVYRDTIHFSRYDSVVVLTLNVFKPDTVVTNVRIPEGTSWDWNGQQYTTPGVYEDLKSNRFGCDSLSQLILSTYRIDTIDTVVSICPSTTFTWHGMTQGTTGDYEFPGTRTNGDKVYYRLHLTVKELTQIDTLFTLCDEESLFFNGKTYVNPGEYYDQYTCDTLYRITVVKHPTQLHLQTGVLDRTHPYYWQYMQDGIAMTDTLDQPGVYEHTTHNPTTGCNDVWRLVLTKDETSYHYIETATICENEPFNWRGRTDLNRLGIGQTTHYYDHYRTVADQDSTYELVLTVHPVPRSTRTIPFCGSVEWNGQTYTESKVVIDTLQSIQYQCDSIVTVVLVKGIPFLHHDTATIMPGETIEWRGQTITHDGQYEDRYISVSGCDSTYTLGVGLKADAPITKTRTWQATICEGDYYEWKGQQYFNSGTFIDTIFVPGSTQDIDSLHILHLTVNPKYAKTERITFLTFPQTYREQTIPGPGTYTFTYHSTLGCDSVITAYIDQEVYRDEQTVVICPGDTHIWDYDGETYNVTGKYTKVEQDKNGNDSVIHVLNLTVRYIPETQVEETICKGQTYVFGDRSLTESGVYRHTFHKTGGCDSVVVLSLNVVSPDTSFVAVQRVENTPYTWNGTTYRDAGTYFFYGTNRFGCDSVAILELTYNQVDTIEEHLTVCPNELPFVWNGIIGNQTQHYSKVVQQPGGNYIYYSLYLTVREIAQVDTTFTICGDESVYFNGKTYSEAGHYRDYLSCDTLVNITITKYPQQIYVTNATLGAGHGYTWTYWDNGTEQTKTFNTAGLYEYESPNAVTGCSELWRLILTQDESEWHFEENLTICEGDDFEWHGLSNLSRVTGTNTYLDEYKTRNGKDSIYTLHLTVIPVERTVRTIVFCGETTWNGKTYTSSTVLYDTISLATGCYRIERINLDKETAFYHSESKELPQGTVLHWHGQNITTDGTYYDYNTTMHGCDSIYELTVTIIPAAPESNQYAEELSTCEGDTIQWRGKDIWRSGVYVDTVYKAGTQNIDSVFTLTFTAWPAPKDTIYQHLYTCADGSSIRYNGKDYYQNDTVVTTFHTIHGCDSIVKVYLHFNTALYLTESDTITDKELPYTWTYKLADVRHDTVLTAAGTYTHIVPAEGGCTNQEEIVLVVFPTYLYELDTTVCETSLPFEWRGKQLQHTIGETKQYEDRYATVNNTDSIYRVNLTIVLAPRRTERISICENKDTLINGKSYFDNTLYVPGVVYHDTAYKHNDGNECDSIIYYEITKVPQHHIIETRIMHVGETISWRGETITELVSKTYTQEDEIDPTTGCENIYQLRVVAEHRTTDNICVLDTPYTQWRGQSLYTTGLYTDTVYDAEGRISEFHTIDLTVDEVPTRVEQYYVCADKPEYINGKWYGGTSLPMDTIFRDTIDGRHSSVACDSVIYMEIYVSSVKEHYETQILHYNEAPIVWNGQTITDGGMFHHTTPNVGPAGCDSISTLHVVKEQRWIVGMCVLEGAYSWRGNTYGTTGLWTDTVFDATGDIQEFHTLQLTIDIPQDTTIYLRGCYTAGEEPKGVTWHDKTYFNDTVFEDTITCEMLYRVHVEIDTTYTIEKVDTICEQYLPYIFGRQNPDTIWSECVRFPHLDTTACGCDSLVYLTLRIIPDLKKNDSTFVCEDFFTNGGVVTLGNLTDPWFEYRENGRFSGTWQEKWKGINYTNDTIVYNCDSSYFHHIIVRPHQAIIPERTYSLCKGDSVQLFWPHDTTWITAPGVYYDTVPTTSSWMDTKHNTYIHNDRAYECDSITKWTVIYADTLHEHLYAHIRQGETYVFNDSILSTTGVYDSIGDYLSSMDSAHHYCKAVYSLHLFVEPVYTYGDTIEICHPANREYTYTFDDDLTPHFAFKFQTPDQDTAIIHLSDSTKHLSYDFYDHFYDLVVYYKQQYFTQIKDTLCYGDSIQFDQHFYDTEHNRTVERYLKEPGIYIDTLKALNGCDSIVELRLELRDRIITEPQSAFVTDRELPYEWTNTWREPGSTTDTTYIDSLYVTGDYTYTMPNQYGCDSTVTIHLTVHPTHVFRDTIDICAFKETTHTHFWNTGYQQKFTVPVTDDTIHCADTLTTLYPLDSIYVLFVNYHEQTITYIDSNMCADQTMRFGLTRSQQERYLSKTGVYRDTLVRITNGCDSIIELRLNVFPTYTHTLTQHISNEELPFIWKHVDANGQSVGEDTLYAAGTYQYPFHSVFGCDSTDNLQLYVHQTYHYRDTVQICQSETPYSWEGISDIYETGEYTRYLQTHDGYDSTLVRFVRVMPVMYDTISATICEGDSMRFGLTKSGQPRFLTINGLYNDTLTSIHGCDSIVTLSLNFYPKYIKHHQVDIADVDTPYIWEHEQAGVIIARDTLWASGEYTYVFKTSHGCDSIDSLSLRIHPTYIFQDSVTICYDQTPYTWFDKQDIYETGTYIKHLQTHDGYDSTYVRYVRVIPVIHDTVRHTICEGSDYLFNGVRYAQDGTYVDTLTSHDGCDSIVTLVLSVAKPYYLRVPVDIYEGESYLFYGTSYSTSGTYRHYGQTPEGCDSITELFLQVHPQVDTIVTVCESELPYIWVNKWTGLSMPLYQAGTYRNDTSYVNGQRTFYTLQLDVNYTQQDTVRVAICEGSSYLFKGEHLTETGIYRDTVRAANGCDSVTTLVLTVNKPYYNTITEHILEGNSVEFFGQTYSTTGTYTHYGRTPEGCDSTSVLQLVVHPMVDTIVTVCKTDLPYLWVNKWNGSITPLYEAGLYRNDTTYVSEDRMFYGLQLIVNEPAYDTVRVAICEGSSYLFKGEHLTETGIYRDTVRATNGCDSVTTLVLTVNKPYYNTITEHILEGNSVEFFGQTYSTTGTYTHYGRTPEGCDSTSVLQLVVHPMVDTIVTVCKTDLPYLWVNKWNGSITPLYEAGLYRNDTTYVGEDRMFYGLQLIVNEPAYDTVRVAICEGSSYLFKGEHLTETGIYRDTVRAANGCDSVTTLVLTVNKPYYNTITEHILEGNSVEFFGQTYSTTGTYTHYGRTPEGCDSTSVLQLVVHPMVDTIVTVCKTDLPYLWVNKWNGSITPLYEAGLYRNDTTYVGEDRMFYGLQLVVNEPAYDTVRVAICEGSSYLFKGEHLTETGIYRDTVRAANGCDSVTTLVLTVNKPYYNTITEHILEGNSVEFFGQTYSTTGTYTHYGRTPEGCDSTSVLQLVVHPMVDTIVTVCKTDLPYLWVNKWNGSITPLYEAGLYRNDTTYVGEDRMFYGLQLVVTQPTDTTIYREICEGDLYNFNNRFLSIAGEYRDTIKNFNGCDSIVILHLNVLKKYYNSIDRSIYEGDTVMFQGIPYSTAGIYPVRLTSSYGCDSIIELRLTVNRLFDDSISVCANELPYLWQLPSDPTQFKTIYESGIYRDTVVNSEGKESTIGLKVKVLPIAYASEPIVATICEGDFYKFGDLKLSEQGTYYDTLTAVNGCDSIIMLSLQVIPVNHQIINRIIFEGDTVIFHDSICMTPGIYTYTERNANGCNDTYQLVLTVLKEFHVDTTAYVCENDLPFRWHDHLYYKTGDYDLVTRMDTARVITTLHLKVDTISYATMSFDMCYGNTFIYKRNEIKNDTIFHDTIPSVAGCDSITKYVIRFHPTYERWDTVHISDTQVFEFKTSDSTSRTLTIPGDYEYTGKTNPSGCDSIIHLHLEVHPAFDSVEYRTICAPDTIHWRNRIISLDTVYKISNTTTRYGKDTVYRFQDKYVSGYGFDSIYNLEVRVLPSYYIYEQIAIKEGETTTMHGIDITETGKVYTDVLHTIYGCDSTYQIAVNTKRMIDVYRDITICEGGYHDLYGDHLTETGLYTKISPNGDTVAHITLTVNPITYSDTTIVITEEDLPYFYAGKFYTKQDLPQDDMTKEVIRHLNNATTNCDSIVYTEIIRTSHYSPWYQFALCKGSTLYIDDVAITKPGRYQFNRRRTDPNDPRKSYMDSLYRVEVYEAPTYNITIERTICNGDFYEFGGQKLTQTGVYLQRETTKDGCDSLVTLQLTVKPAVHVDTYVSLWPEEFPYTWSADNKTYQYPGDYPLVWYTEECANTNTLHLNMLKPDTTTVAICVGDTITWRGKEYSENGYYTDIVYDYSGSSPRIADIYVLNLSVQYPTKITNAYIEDVIENKDTLVIHFTYNGYKPSNYDIIFDNKAKNQGFENLYNVPVTSTTVKVPFKQPNGVCTPDNMPSYIRPDNYTLQLVVGSAACGISNSGNLPFQIKYPSWIIEQNWDDVVAPRNAEYNGGYEFSDINWYVNNQLQPKNGLGYLHYNGVLEEGYTVEMEAYRKGETYSIRTYPLVITTPTPYQEYPTINNPVTIYPKQAPRHTPIVNAKAPKDGTYEIFSSTGQLVSTGMLEEGITQITLPYNCGIYVILTHQDTETTSHKVLIY